MQPWLNTLAAADWQTIRLPWPPSTNRVWNHGRKGVFLAPVVKQYRTALIAEILAERFPSFEGPVIASIELHPPSQRATDLDNREKALWDALEVAGVLCDDCQVCGVLRFWGTRVKRGAVTLGLATLTDANLLESIPGWASVSKEGQKVDGNGTKQSRRGGDGKPKSKRRGKPKVNIIRH